MKADKAVEQPEVYEAAIFFSIQAPCEKERSNEQESLKAPNLCYESSFLVAY